MKKLIRDGKVAVLYSPGYGAGWSTWNSDKPELVFDPSVVVMVEDMEKDLNKEDWVANIIAYVESKYEDTYVSTHGVEDLRIAWIPEGTRFRITEYDGFENVEILDDVPWIIA